MLPVCGIFSLLPLLRLLFCSCSCFRRGDLIPQTFTLLSWFKHYNLNLNLNWPRTKNTIKPWAGMEDLSVEDMVGRWLALFFYLLWIYESFIETSYQKNTQHQQQLLRFRRRMGYSIFPWPWAFTRTVVYFLVFFTYFQAILWVLFEDELIELFWESTDRWSSLHFQVTFMIWSRLPTILQSLWWVGLPEKPVKFEKPQRKWNMKNYVLIDIVSYVMLILIVYELICVQ